MSTKLVNHISLFGLLLQWRNATLISSPLHHLLLSFLLKYQIQLCLISKENYSSIESLKLMFIMEIGRHPQYSHKLLSMEKLKSICQQIKYSHRIFKTRQNYTSIILIDHNSQGANQTLIWIVQPLFRLWIQNWTFSIKFQFLFQLLINHEQLYISKSELNRDYYLKEHTNRHSFIY